MDKSNRRPRFSALVVMARTSRLLMDELLARDLGWLVPLVSLLLVLSVILTFLAAAGPLAPFLYPLL